MSFLDTINAIEDLPEAGELPLGSITWMHGSKQGRTPGAFFGKATEFNGTPAAPWVLDERFDNDPGYSAPTLRLAFVAWRSQWYMEEERSGKKFKSWIIDYQQGARKQVEYIVFAEGVDEPMILTLPKFTKAKPIQDIVKEYQDGLLKQAARLAKRALPLWSFWVPIQGVQKDGKPVYDEVQRAGTGTGAYVTYPVAAFPTDAMDSLFVGEELLRRGADVARTYGKWREERRLPPQIAEGEVVTIKQLPAGRNVPQPVEEADLF